MKYFVLTLLPLIMALTTIAAEPPKNIVLILADDLGETKDLAGSNPERLQELKKGLAGWEAEMAKTAAVFPAKK